MLRFGGLITFALAIAACTAGQRAARHAEPPPNASSEASKRMQATARRYAQLRRLFDDLNELCRSCGGLGTQFHSGRSSLVVRTDCFFAPGTATLKPKAAPLIKQVAAKLSRVADRNYLVASHLRLGIRVQPPFRSKWGLSAAQAAEFVQALVGASMAPSRLGAVGYGDADEPLDYDGPAGLSPGDNSLIEIVLAPNGDEFPSP